MRRLLKGTLVFLGISLLITSMSSCFASQDSWNKNPYLDAVESEYVPPNETDQDHFYYDWRIEFFRWSRQGGTHEKGLGEAWWFADGGIVRIRSQASGLKGSTQYCRLYQDQSMIGWSLRVGDCSYLRLEGRARLVNWSLSDVYFNGLYDLWFRVVSTYRGVTRERDLCVDVAWVTNQPVKHHWIDSNEGFHYYYPLDDARRPDDQWRTHELGIMTILENARTAGDEIFGWGFDPSDCRFNWMDWGIEIFERTLVRGGSGDITVEVDYYVIAYLLKSSQTSFRLGKRGLS